MKTHKVAHDEIIRGFTDEGWAASSPTLKVRHITSPNGKCRLWFKQQSIHFSTTGPKGQHLFGNARSLGLDPREKVWTDNLEIIKRWFSRELL